MKSVEVEYENLKEKIRKYILWHMNRSRRIALTTSAEYWGKRCSEKFGYAFDECMYWIKKFDWKVDGISYCAKYGTLSKVY